MAATDIAHFAGGVVLMLALLLLARRQAREAVGLYALQSAVLALAMAAQAWAQGSAALGLAALAVLVGKAVLVPAGLRRAEHTDRFAAGGLAAMGVGAAVVVVALLAFRPVPLPASVAREDLAAAFATLLLGLLAVVMRRGVLGFLVAETGYGLAAASVPGGSPLILALGWALLLIPGMGLWLSRGEGAA